MAAAARAIYHRTDLPFVTTLPIGHVSNYLQFHSIFYCPSGYLHVENKCISKLEIERFFYEILKMT